MNAELYRLKTSRDEGKYALMHEGREWVFACALTQYAADAEILIESGDGREVVLFADLDDHLEAEGVCII
tara:strand:+ start:776 stop:985 length:210 start_codon:yes stop_codon:yes gene_type:complete